MYCTHTQKLKKRHSAGIRALSLEQEPPSWVELVVCVCAVVVVQHAHIEEPVLVADPYRHRDAARHLIALGLAQCFGGGDRDRFHARILVTELLIVGEASGECKPTFLHY